MEDLRFPRRRGRESERGPQEWSSRRPGSTGSGTLVCPVQESMLSNESKNDMIVM